MEMSVCGIKVATKLGGCLVHFFQTLNGESEVVVEEPKKQQLAKPSSSSRSSSSPTTHRHRKSTTHSFVVSPSKQAKKKGVPPTSSSSSRFDLTCGRSAPSSSLEHSRYLKEEARRTIALTAEPSSKSKKQRSSAKKKMSQMKSPHMSTNIKSTTIESPTKEDTTTDHLLPKNIKVLNVTRNAREESITTFDIRHRMSRFEKDTSSSSTNREKASTPPVEIDDLSLDSEDSEDSFEKRRASYRQTANKHKNLRKQKKKEAKLYLQSRNSQTLGSDLQLRLSGYCQEHTKNSSSFRLDSPHTNVTTPSSDDEFNGSIENLIPTSSSDKEPPSVPHLSSHQAKAASKTSEQKKTSLKSKFKSFMSNKSSTSEEERRMELQLIMRDKSLSKYERKMRLEEVNAKFASPVSSFADKISDEEDKAARRAKMEKMFTDNSEKWLRQV